MILLNIFLICLLGVSILLNCFAKNKIDELENKYAHVPKPLMAIIENYPKSFLLECEILNDYAKNKIVNANSRLQVFKLLKAYSENAINRELKNINK